MLSYYIRQSTPASYSIRCCPNQTARRRTGTIVLSGRKLETSEANRRVRLCCCCCCLASLLPCLATRRRSGQTSEAAREKRRHSRKRRQSTDGRTERMIMPKSNNFTMTMTGVLFLSLSQLLISSHSFYVFACMLNRRRMELSHTHTMNCCATPAIDYDC